MKIMARVGILLIVVAVVLLADRLLGNPLPLQGFNTPPRVIESQIDPSIPATTFNDSALANLEGQVKKDPKNGNAFQQLGFGYIQKARDTGDPSYYGRAQSALEAALAINNQDTDAMVGMGSLSLSRHEFQDALSWGFKAYAINPHSARIYGVITDAYVELGNYSGAVEAAQNMVNTRPDLSSYSRVSYVRELHGDVPGAITAMQQAVEAGSPAAENTNWCRVQLGLLYWLENDLTKAEAQYQQVLTYYPTYVYALGAMGQLRAGQGKWDEAADYYTKATTVIPLPQYVTALGDVYARQGKTVEAQKQYDLFQFIFRTYEANGVKVDIERALFLADHDLDLTTALDLAQKAAAVRQDIHTQDSLAWVLYKNGKYSEAKAASDQALRMGKRDPIFYYHAGMIAKALGDTAGARTQLQKALALNPHFHPLYADGAAATLKALGP